MTEIFTWRHFLEKKFDILVVTLWAIVCWIMGIC